MDQNNRQTPKRRRKKGFDVPILLAALFLVLSILIFIHAFSTTLSPGTGDQLVGDTPGTSDSDTPKPSSGEPDDSTNPDTSASDPTDPHVTNTASIGVTGDVLVHGPLIRSAEKASGKTGQYDFTSMFTYIAPYFKEYDFMVANLETTLGGKEAGEYKGYPNFNCPDDMIDALKGAGVDLILTANNHSYDTGEKGFLRTQEVIQNKGLPHLGTQLNADDPDYLVQDINGIKVGMICYTYETVGDNPERKYLNGIQMSQKAAPLVTSFSYDKLPQFYDHLEDQMAQMEAEGAEATVVYIHWGEEYMLKPNTKQKDIAQKLCDLGVDVIVGGHPHVIEPFDTLTSENGNTTYCIYSVGNAISNQNRVSLDGTANKEYTEDGMVFGFTLQKWSDGTVEVSEVDILPTWVDRVANGSVYNYTVYPLDTAVEAWSEFHASSNARLIESYNHTMSLVGEGLNECRKALGLEEVILKLEK